MNFVSASRYASSRAALALLLVEVMLLVEGGALSRRRCWLASFLIHPKSPMMLVEAPLAAAAFPRTLRYPLQSSKHNCRTIRFSCPPVTIIHLLPTPEKGFQFHTSFFSSTSSITRAFNTITHKHNAPCLCRRRRPSIVATIVCPMPQRLPYESLVFHYADAVLFRHYPKITAASVFICKNHSNTPSSGINITPKPEPSLPHKAGMPSKVTSEKKQPRSHSRSCN